MIQTGKKKTIGTIVIVVALISATIGISLSKAQQPTFVLYATHKDSIIAFIVHDSSFVSEDSLLLLQRKKGNDTLPALARLSYAATAAHDSTVLSQDTLTQIRVVEEK